MKATVLVASPSATGRIPVASGSSVPACPVFTPVAWRMRTTASFEVMPPGLSMTSQPCSPGSAFILVPQVALDRLAMEDRGDAPGAVESAVEGKGEVRHKPEPNQPGDAALEERRAAAQAGHDVGRVGAAQRHDEGERVAQIGADPHLG